MKVKFNVKLHSSCSELLLQLHKSFLGCIVLSIVNFCVISNCLWLFTVFFKLTKAPLECSSKDAVETRLMGSNLTVWGQHVGLSLSSYSYLSILLSLGYSITTHIFLTEHKKWLMVAPIWSSHLGRTFSPATLFCLNLFLTHLPDAFYHVQCHSPLPERHL